MATCLKNTAKRRHVLNAAVIKGFKSEDEAWKYIKKHCFCSSYKKELKQRFIIVGKEKDEETINIDHPAETSCGAEWMVETEEQYVKDLKD